MAKRYANIQRGLTPVVVREAAAILGETERNLRKQIAAGRYSLLAGPQSRERVLLPSEVVEQHAQRESAAVSPPAESPPLVRYAMTPQAVALVADEVLRRYAEASAAVQQDLREQYERRLVSQERTIALQARLIDELAARVARAEAQSEAADERHRLLHDRLVALVEMHASRSLIGQVGRLIASGRE